MSAFISVIIPVYNGERFIADALESICQQTTLPLEIVVADDASTDSTPDIVESFARRSRVPVRMIRMERNTGGPYEPASRAFAETRGDFLIVLDADDMFEPYAFATYLRMYAAPSTGQVGLATSDFHYFDNVQGLHSRSYFARHPTLMRRVLQEDNGCGIEIAGPEAVRMQAAEFCLPFRGLLRREAWVSLGGPNLAYVVICDCDFMWRLATLGTYTIRVTKRPLQRVRLSPGSMSTNIEPMAKELIRLFRTMIRDVDDSDLKRQLASRLDKELFDLTYHAYKHRRFTTLIPAALDLGAFRALSLLHCA